MGAISASVARRASCYLQLLEQMHSRRLKKNRAIRASLRCAKLCTVSWRRVAWVREDHERLIVEIGELSETGTYSSRRRRFDTRVFVEPDPSHSGGTSLRFIHRFTASLSVEQATERARAKKSSSKRRRCKADEVETFLRHLWVTEFSGSGHTVSFTTARRSSIDPMKNQRLQSIAVSRTAAILLAKKRGKPITSPRVYTSRSGCGICMSLSSWTSPDHSFESKQTSVYLRPRRRYRLGRIHSGASGRAVLDPRNSDREKEGLILRRRRRLLPLLLIISIRSRTN